MLTRARVNDGGVYEFEIRQDNSVFITVSTERRVVLSRVMSLKS